jgi:hypothetical protein
MKILITGGRKFTDYALIHRALAGSGCTILVHGDAPGADTLADIAARDLGITDIRSYPADWKRFSLAAGPIRNQEMLDKEHRPEEPIDACFAFPTGDSRGTWDMVSKVVALNHRLRLQGKPEIRLVTFAVGADDEHECNT